MTESSVSEWKDITLPLGKNIPVLSGGSSERPVLSPKVERFFDVDKGDAGPCRAILRPLS